MTKLKITNTTDKKHIGEEVEVTDPMIFKNGVSFDHTSVVDQGNGKFKFINSNYIVEGYLVD